MELFLDKPHKTARASFPDVWGNNRHEPLGGLFIIPSAFEAVVRSDEITPLRSFVFELQHARLQELMGISPDGSNWQLVTGLDLKSPRIRDLMLRAAAETRQPGYAAELLIDAIATELSIELVRLGNKLRDEYGHGGLAPWQLRAIDERLQEIVKAPKIEELADICKISVRQLARGFRASRGCSLGALIVSNRIAHAQVLRPQNHSITEIAQLLGFSTSSNFCFAFRRQLGVTPSQYKKSLS